MSGEVSAVSDTTVTVVSPSGETISAAVSTDTHVFILVTQTEGTLADVQVGTTVQIMGRPDDSGAVTADGIVVVPAGDTVRGEITAVDEATLVLEDNMPMRSPQDSPSEGTPVAESVPVVNTVVIEDVTQFFISGTEVAIDDVAVGQFATAYGTTKTDGSLLATVLIVSDAQQGPGGMGMEPGGPGGGAPGGPRGGGPAVRGAIPRSSRHSVTLRGWCRQSRGLGKRSALLQTPLVRCIILTSTGLTQTCSSPSSSFRHMLSGALMPIRCRVRAKTCFAASTSLSRALLNSRSAGSEDSTRHCL